jgi:hypothetical protein
MMAGARADLFLNWDVLPTAPLAYADVSVARMYK